MRHAIWERDPTNDLRVIQFCLSVPEKQFVQNGQDRSLIRRSMKNLPDNIRLSQKKRGLQGADGILRMLPHGIYLWRKFNNFVRMSWPQVPKHNSDKTIFKKYKRSS